MAVAKVVEISAASGESFEDAIATGMSERFRQNDDIKALIRRLENGNTVLQWENDGPNHTTRTPASGFGGTVRSEFAGG